MSYVMMRRIYPRDPGAGAGRFQPRDDGPLDPDVVQVEFTGSWDDQGNCPIRVVGEAWGYPQASRSDWEGEVKHVWCEDKAGTEWDLLAGLPAWLVKELEREIAERGWRDRSKYEREPR